MATKTTLPLLNTVMRIGKISNERLAEVSGVSCRTISEVRRGGVIKTSLAEIISYTVYHRFIHKGA